MTRIVALFGFAFALSGCLSGAFIQSDPAVERQGQETRLVDLPRDEVWKRFIPELSKSFFIINNIDKESGFINVSYSGDAERYVDGGTITSWVKQGGDRREYVFPATSAYEVYESFERGFIFQMDRKVDLEGRINITMMEIEHGKTQVTVNAKYVLRKTGGASRNYLDQNFQQRYESIPFDMTISFSSGDGGKSFAGQPGVYRPTGELEREVLALLGS